MNDKLLDISTHETTKKINEWFMLWDVNLPISDVTIEFSKRLKTSLGRTHVAKHLVRLNPILLKAEAGYLSEVLCHELAHIAVYEKYGASAKPHGVQWAELMRKAGYEPHVRLVSKESIDNKAMTKYEHFCPVCQSVRYAYRAMRQWRCSSCIDAGLKGKLMIKSTG